MAIENARYVHTNLVADDWKRLAHFYVEVFGCIAVPPAREHRGTWLSQVTGVEGAKIDGIHLRLPGCGDDGPTLEIFSYHEPPDAGARVINQPGFAHIAFAVDDVDHARQAVKQAGGSDYGEQVTVAVPAAGTITMIYMRDPEGNIVELQRWHPVE